MVKAVNTLEIEKAMLEAMDPKPTEVSVSHHGIGSVNVHGSCLRQMYPDLLTAVVAYNVHGSRLRHAADLHVVDAVDAADAARQFASAFNNWIGYVWYRDALMALDPPPALYFSNVRDGQHDIKCIWDTNGNEKTRVNVSFPAYSLTEDKFSELVRSKRPAWMETPVEPIDD